MSGRAKTLLSDASNEELASCIRLLALSVAHHRQKTEFIPLRDSADFLSPKNMGKEKALLFLKSRDLVEEAMELIRVLSAETPIMDDEAEQKAIEKRTQLRINVTTSIRIIWPGTSEPVRARLQNISWGGASILVDKVHTQAGDTIQIILPGIHTPMIQLEAKVLRSWVLTSSQGEGMAIRFSSITTKDQDEFECVLKKLAQSSDTGGLREHARLSQHLDIQFDGPDELHATLDDISAGGLGVTVPDPLQIGQSLESVISTMDGDFSLKLRARVVRLEPVKMGKIQLYHAGLKFEHPSAELSALTRELIAKMASANK